MIGLAIGEKNAPKWFKRHLTSPIRLLKEKICYNEIFIMSDNKVIQLNDKRKNGTGLGAVMVVGGGIARHADCDRSCGQRV